MTEYEFAIMKFLKGSPETFFARKEIACKAVKRMVYSGYYRIKRDASF